ncbi:MAG: hypothetical protein WAO74_07840 [Polaribacter sp.]|uniref:hypothetical protein n=1 Tax=Polaribacter sp. TaxID=1920175 RepID=UPI003BB0A593
MKKGFLIAIIFFGFWNINAQVKPTKKAEPIKVDTVKTEVIEVITAYNPKIADATKITKNPVIELSKDIEKKKLKYTIFSAPVASTFIPKSGVVKGIDVGVRERIYNNYIAAGFGNFTSPYLEAYIHSNTRFKSEFGLHTKYAASLENIDNTSLDSKFSNLSATLFYKQEERYFDWKASLETQRNEYNWYGLSNLNFTPNTINFINENQAYNYLRILGEIDFLDAYIDESSLSISYFNDAFSSSEFLMNLNTNLDLPLNFINSNLNNLYIRTSLEFLNGEFSSNYMSQNPLEYSIFTAKINPEYKTILGTFSLQVGAKFFAAFDTENSVNHFLVYPDLLIQKPLVKESLNMYAGVFGDLKTNTYKDFSEENPFVSPTLFITQTAERYNAFLGLNGVINNDVSFNISATIKDEQDKPLFIKNNSKSDGTNTIFNGDDLKGYEFGNSFHVIYDDIKTTSIFAELEYDFTKRITFATNFQFDSFTTTNESEAWNLPTVQASFITAYKNNKWYATSNIFYVGERKELSFGSSFPANSNGIRTLESFVDINLNGGYHFNDKFSAFLKLNNILNNSYQRFADFNVQGFQVLGGLTYKFDF